VPLAAIHILVIFKIMAKTKHTKKRAHKSGNVNPRKRFAFSLRVPAEPRATTVSDFCSRYRMEDACQKGGCIWDSSSMQCKYERAKQAAAIKSLVPHPPPLKSDDISSLSNNFNSMVPPSSMFVAPPSTNPLYRDQGPVPSAPPPSIEKIDDKINFEKAAGKAAERSIKPLAPIPPLLPVNLNESLQEKTNFANAAGKAAMRAFPKTILQKDEWVKYPEIKQKLNPKTSFLDDIVKKPVLKHVDMDRKKNVEEEPSMFDMIRAKTARIRDATNPLENNKENNKDDWA